MRLVIDDSATVEKPYGWVFGHGGAGGPYRQQGAGSPVTIERVVDSGASGATTRRRWPVLLAVLGVLALLVAVAGVFGGLKAQESGPQRVKAGSTVGQGLFDVQIMDARAGRMKFSSYDPAANALVVRMRVTNLGKQTFGVSSFLNGVAAEPKPRTYLAADTMKSAGDAAGYETSSIHPRMPVIVQAVWPLPEGTTPRSVTVAFRRWEYGQSFTSDTIYWSVTKQSPIQAEVFVPVRAGATS
jgi:hypothetical protein